jgi:hypothetical protein
MHAMAVLAGNLDSPGHYIQIFGSPIQISVGNLVVIGSMVVLFALAILLPFPKDKERR